MIGMKKVAYGQLLDKKGRQLRLCPLSYLYTILEYDSVQFNTTLYYYRRKYKVQFKIVQPRVQNTSKVHTRVQEYMKYNQDYML